MYYLNDKHYDYEFCLYTKVGTALPYLTDLRYVNSVNDLYRYIESIEKKHNHFSQVFYIDNSFYHNKYSCNQNGTYYKFLFRRVEDWLDFDNFEKYSDSDIYDNVYYFKDFC